MDPTDTERPKIRIHHGNARNTPITVGVPFPADAAVGEGAGIVFEDGSERCAQAAPLTPATPGGVRWWELSFLSSGEGPAGVQPDAGPAPAGPPIAAETAAGVVLDNGLGRAVASGEADVPVRILWNDAEGTLRPEVLTEELGACCDLPDCSRTVTILRNGPIRARVEVTGTLAGTGGELDYRLTLEMWKEHPALRVDWMVTNRVPDIQDLHVRRATLRGDWQVGETTERVFRQNAHGTAWKPRDVVNPDPVELVADESGSRVHVADPQMLRDDTEYPFYCSPPTIVTGDWLELRGSNGRVSARPVDFAETRPNALMSRGSELSYHMVPPREDQPLTWPQGRRKEQNLLFAFAGPDDERPPEELAAEARSVFAIGRAQPAPETLRRLGCFDLDRILAFERGKNLRLNAVLSRLCKLQSVASMWDLGDTPDWHYTRGYAGGANQYMPLPGAEEFPRKFSSSGFVFPDALKYFLEPVWTNNEYDVIHTLGIEVMRTGKPDHFRMLRWTARHNVEVDFVSYSDDPWHHRASPFHSHFHNRKGAITSHFWTQGLLQYYCLTGDRDALEVARALGDKIIEVDDSEVREWKFDREIGWALLALTCLAEVGYEKYLEEAGRIADFLRSYDRSRFSGAVNLSAGRAGLSLERQMIDNGFGYSSMIEALDRYEKLVEDEDLTAWFRDLLHDLKDAFWEKIGDGEPVGVRSMVGLMMAIGYERTGEEDFLVAGRLVLETYLESSTPGSEGGQVKPCAMAYRGLHRLLGALERAGQLQQYEYPAHRDHFSDERTIGAM